MQFKHPLATIGLFLCILGTAFAADYPNQPAIPIEDENGDRRLQHWSEGTPTDPRMTGISLPDNPAYAGASIWMVKLPRQAAESAAKTGFEAAGMKKVKIIATADGNPAAMKVLDNSETAEAKVVMVDGVIGDEGSRGIALILRGQNNGTEKSTVHGFLAPTDAFVALGGFAVPAVQWLQASAEPGDDMSLDGALPPQQAVNKLRDFFTVWVSDYVIPMLGITMQMQMQSIQSMQSWNNAMNACAGDSSCTVVPQADGNWEAVNSN